MHKVRKTIAVLLLSVMLVSIGGLAGAMASTPVLVAAGNMAPTPVLMATANSGVLVPFTCWTITICYGNACVTFKICP